MFAKGFEHVLDRTNGEGRSVSLPKRSIWASIEKRKKKWTSYHIKNNTRIITVIEEKIKGKTGKTNIYAVKNKSGYVRYGKRIV